MTDKSIKSVYRYGAEYGLFIGLYLTVMSASMLAFPYMPDAILLFYLMGIGLPIVIFLMFRRLLSVENRFANYSSLFMFGSTAFFCGAMICGVLTAGYMAVFSPNHIYEYVEMVIATLENSPLQSEYVNEIDAARNLISNQELPSPIEYVFSMIWLTILSGSLMSMILAPIVCFVNKVKPKN